MAHLKCGQEGSIARIMRIKRHFYPDVNYEICSMQSKSEMVPNKNKRRKKQGSNYHFKTVQTPKSGFCLSRKQD